MNKIKSIHFVGIKGVGMTPLAIIAKEAGFTVSGSDIKDSFITDESLSKANIKPLIGFSEKHIGNTDLVITTGAHGGFSNIEVVSARRKNIKVITQGQAVGEFMSGKIFARTFIGISVAGTHGKTTTTAMTATILKKTGLDPSFVVGTGFVQSLGSSGHYGKGKHFVAEADEYATEPKLDRTAKFLWQHPKIAIFTNIEFDHPDVYRSIDDVRNAFLKFANQLPKNGILVACGDDKQVKKFLLKEYKGKRVTYGFNRDNDFIINEVKHLSHSGERSHVRRGRSDSRISNHDKRFWTSQNDRKLIELLEFRLARKNRNLGKFRLNVFGAQNALNATGAIIAALELGLPIATIKKSLLKFTGTKRRSEYIGQLLSGARLYDDYAHHPTEIQKTLSAFRSRFPKSKIVCVFQPHTYSRTKLLFEQFVKSFNHADVVILTNIYASLREKPDLTISSRDLADKISRLKEEVFFIPELPDVIEYIDKMNFDDDTIIITMGAGDVYKINSKFDLLASGRNSK